MSAYSMVYTCWAVGHFPVHFFPVLTIFNWPANMDGWMYGWLAPVCPFQQEFRHIRVLKNVIMVGFVQWIPVYDWKDFLLNSINWKGQGRQKRTAEYTHASPFLNAISKLILACETLYPCTLTNVMGAFTFALFCHSVCLSDCPFVILLGMDLTSSTTFKICLLVSDMIKIWIWLFDVDKCILFQQRLYKSSHCGQPGYVDCNILL